MTVNTQYFLWFKGWGESVVESSDGESLLPSMGDGVTSMLQYLQSFPLILKRCTLEIQGEIFTHSVNSIKIIAKLSFAVRP